jgi:glycosyltransferase involved in cell wall biosynthesis
MLCAFLLLQGMTRLDRTGAPRSRRRFAVPPRSRRRFAVPPRSRRLRLRRAGTSKARGPRVAASRGHPGSATAAAPLAAGSRRAPGAGGERRARRGAERATVSVVIPTLNEEGSLPWVLENLPAWVDEVVLVDGLSTDATQQVARRMRPDALIVHQFRRGKGAALRAGFAAAGGDIVVMIDADGSTDPREMDRFIEPLLDGADLVKGSRYLAGGGSVDFTRVRSGGNRCLVEFANRLHGARFTDLCYGYCAFWRRHVYTLGLTSDGFEIETELVLAALRARLDIREVPSLERRRIAGSSNLNAFADGLRVLRTMLGRKRRRERASIDFTLRPVELPVWRADALPGGVERRRRDRRVRDRELSGYGGPERRRLERRECVGSAVAYRAEYDGADEVAKEMRPPSPVLDFLRGRSAPARRRDRSGTEHDRAGAARARREPPVDRAEDDSHDLDKRSRDAA